MYLYFAPHFNALVNVCCNWSLCVCRLQSKVIYQSWNILSNRKYLRTKLPLYPILSILSYPILSATWKCLQSMPSHHTPAFVIIKTSKPVKHTCDSQTGATNTPGLLQFWGLVRSITATLSSVQIRNPGIANLKDMSVLVILAKFFFVVCPAMAMWCAEKASVCGGGTWISGWWGCQYGGTTNFGYCTEHIETEEEKCVND